MSKPSAKYGTTLLEARIAADVLATIRRAAEIRGQSLSDFVVASAHSEGERVIEAAEVTRLSMADLETLARTILTPAEPNEALRRAKRAHDHPVLVSR